MCFKKKKSFPQVIPPNIHVKSLYSSEGMGCLFFLADQNELTTLRKHPPSASQYFSFCKEIDF